MSVLSPSGLYLVICNIFIARCRAPRDDSAANSPVDHPILSPFSRFPHGPTSLFRPPSYYPPFSPLALPFPPPHSLPPFVLASRRRKDGRGVPCCAERGPAQHQSSWNVRVPSDFVAYTSHPAEIAATVGSDVLRITLRDTVRIRGREYTAGGTVAYASLHPSVYRAPLDTACDTATVRESPLAFAVTKERGEGERQNGN